MIRNVLQDVVQRALGAAGLRLVPASSARTMSEALRELSRRHPVATVVDVGASNGMWTNLARRHYPDAHYLLVEAQAKPHEPALAKLKASSDRLDYVIAAAGDRAGTIHFDASDPLGGLASETPTGANDIVVPVTTVDEEISRRGWPGPYLLKLDTHGFELPILEGAKDVLRRAGALVIEAYNFQLTGGSLRFHELCAWLEERGFRCIDLVDVLYRPGDGALWQMDLFFVPTTSPEFSSNAYESPARPVVAR